MSLVEVVVQPPGWFAEAQSVAMKQLFQSLRFSAIDVSIRW